MKFRKQKVVSIYEEIKIQFLGLTLTPKRAQIDPKTPKITPKLEI